MIRRGPPTEMYSGRELELDLLGKPRFPKEFQAAVRAVSTEGGYVQRGAALDLIRQHYPEDPTNPVKDFARELRLAVIEELDLPDGDEVGFYSAVGTPLDVYHGIDAWIDLAYSPLGGGPVRHAVVTLDATLRRDKLEEGHKADLIIPDMPDVSSPKYLSEIEEYARLICEQLGIQLPPRWRPVKSVSFSGKHEQSARP